MEIVNCCHSIIAVIIAMLPETLAYAPFREFIGSIIGIQMELGISSGSVLLYMRYWLVQMVP